MAVYFVAVSTLSCCRINRAVLIRQQNFIIGRRAARLHDKTSVQALERSNGASGREHSLEAGRITKKKETRNEFPFPVAGMGLEPMTFGL